MNPEENLRVELEKNSKELEVYKKAFDMVCNELGNKETNCRFCQADCTRYYNPSECGLVIREYFLQKARES